MLDSERLRLFRAKLREPNPAEALLTMAKQMRDAGLSQVDLYVLFAHFQQRLSPEDPLYDAVLDNMDAIWGGGWAKGGALYATELDAATRPVDRAVLLGPWTDVGVSEDANLEAELVREVGPQHPLAGRRVRALMRRADRDDVLFALVKSPEVALVHLTWSGSPEPAGYPRTQVFGSMLDWYEQIESGLTDT
jgi:hypothetical protein